MPRFFVKDNQIENNKIKIQNEDVKHIKNVLRKNIGDKIEICNQDKEESFNAVIEEISEKEIICSICQKLNTSSESNIYINVFQGLPKADKMEYIIQKSTELGVKTIVPVSTKRCIVKLEGKDEVRKIDRWQKIAEVAAKQSGRDMIPKIEGVMKFQDVKSIIPEFDLFIVAYEEENGLTLKEVLQKEHLALLSQGLKESSDIELKDKMESPIKKNYLKIGIVIGPEGRI